MADYRYVNRNPFPISVPGPRGAQVHFPIGHKSNNPWFSRFVGRKLLTRESIGPPTRGNVTAPVIVTSRTPSEKLQKKLKKQQVQRAATNKAMRRAIQSVDEETSYWKRAGGIYYCKKCDLFRTGSKAAIVLHLQTFHSITDLKPTTPELPKVVSTPKLPELEVKATEPEEEKVAEVVGEAKTVDMKKVVAPTAEKVADEKSTDMKTVSKKQFFCPHCDRKYTTQSYLSRHVAKEHSVERDE